MVHYTFHGNLCSKTHDANVFDLIVLEPDLKELFQLVPWEIVLADMGTGFLRRRPRCSEAVDSLRRRRYCWSPCCHGRCLSRAVLSVPKTRPTRFSTDSWD